MKVGDEVWMFDGNRRIYEKNGVKSTLPIFEGHFYKDTIDGETERSWIVSHLRGKGLYTNPILYWRQQRKPGERRMGRIEV